MSSQMDGFHHMTEIQNLIYCYTQGIGNKKDHERIAKALNESARALDPSSGDLPEIAKQLLHGIPGH